MNVRKQVLFYFDNKPLWCEDDLNIIFGRQPTIIENSFELPLTKHMNVINLPLRYEDDLIWKMTSNYLKTF